jgi:hypothetical protein
MRAQLFLPVISKGHSGTVPAELDARMIPSKLALLSKIVKKSR